MLRLRPCRSVPFALGQQVPGTPAGLPAGLPGVDLLPSGTQIPPEFGAVLTHPMYKVAKVGFIAAGAAKLFPGKFFMPFLTGVAAALMTGVAKDGGK